MKSCYHTSIRELTLYTYYFDGDKAGRDAATGLNKYASEVFNIKILDLEDGKDPGSLTQKEVNEIKEKII